MTKVAAMPMYDKNLWKSSTPEQRMPWGLTFAKIIADGKSTKIANMMVVHWRLTFLRRGQVCFPMHLYGHHTFVWEKYWEFQTTSPLTLKPMGQCCSNLMWSLLRLGERKIAKMVALHWPRWLPCTYMVKTFKNLLLQNQISLGPYLCTNPRWQKIYHIC